MSEYETYEYKISLPYEQLAEVRRRIFENMYFNWLSNKRSRSNGMPKKVVVWGKQEKPKEREVKIFLPFSVRSGW